MDSWIFLNELSTWCRINNPIETARGLIIGKSFKGLCDIKDIYEVKPEYINSLRNLIHLRRSILKLRKTFGFQH